MVDDQNGLPAGIPTATASAIARKLPVTPGLVAITNTMASIKVSVVILALQA